MIPDPPDTQPRGGATHTLGHHSLVDVGEMVKRATDEVIAMRSDHDKLTGVVMRHDGQIGELIPLVRASIAMPRALQAVVASAAVIGAFALVAIALALVTFARQPSASAAQQGNGTTASYRTP